MEAAGASEAESGGKREHSTDVETGATIASDASSNNDDLHVTRNAEEEEEDDEGEEDEDDEEPLFKYASLTKSIGSVYRNGDSTSCFFTAGDKMVRVIDGCILADID